MPTFAPPPLWLREEAHSLVGEGVGESQFQRGDILYTVVLYIYMYFVTHGSVLLRKSG